jgi:deazaflavin-dependent oxidoreductase (nitroreductase family)
MSMALPAGALRAWGKLNVPLYRLSKGRLGGKIGRAPVLLLTATGRRSGQSRTAPVLYLLDGERYVVIGSNAGHARTPAWSLNLEANPDAEVEVRGNRQKVRARVAAGEERAELWRRANEQYQGFDDYDARTARDIRVFVLDPRP